MIIEVPRLNYREIPLIIRDLGYSNKPRFDITDYRVIVTIKEFTTDGETLIRIQKDTDGGGGIKTDAVNGEWSLIVTPGDLNLPPTDYKYDVFVIKDNEAYSNKPDIFRVDATVLGELPI